jgi:hypothetical protein
MLNKSKEFTNCYWKQLNLTHKIDIEREKENLKECICMKDADSDSINWGVPKNLVKHTLIHQSSCMKSMSKCLIEML